MQILAIGGRDFNAGRGTGNMTVSEDQTIGRHDDARTGAAARLTALARPAGIAVKYRKPHDSWPDALDDVDDRPRIGVKERLIVRGHGSLRGVSPAAQGVA
jgi:hypothetical protein